jgi:glucosamine--fructose-6-phosphate aminotransferase (isomerizing)
MCGIVACRVEKAAAAFLLPALRRLEYRGYDSAGIAVTETGNTALHTVRAVGRLAALEARLAVARPPQACGVGIGHTRWATHGGVSETNAHPHRDCRRSVAVVHNGIIDNADELRTELEQAGHRFDSEVDSEVVAHLVEDGLAAGARLVDAVRAATGRLRGSWALAVTRAGSDTVVLASYRSPLVVGSSPAGHYAASDLAALVGTVPHVQVLQDGDIVEIADGVSWSDSAGRRLPERPAVRIDWDAEDAEMGVYQDFMEKEISEQPAATGRLVDRLAGDIATGRLWKDLDLPTFDAVRFVACGTSLNASSVAARVFRQVAGIPAAMVVASEYEPEPGTAPGVLTVAVSQSGETADVLAALEATDGPVLAITNAPHSTLARRADAVIECSVGPEIGVAATKTFTAQVVVGAALAMSSAVALGRAAQVDVEAHVRTLAGLPERLEFAHLLAFPVANTLAQDLTEAPGFFFVSRGAGMPYAAEGALKLKEITYRWADAIAAGELKHGSIALIDDTVPVVLIDSGSASRMRGAAAEMSARGARIIQIGSDPASMFPVLPEVETPWGPLEAVIALQHLARSLAVALGRDADKPRNLAKSVTVL